MKYITVNPTWNVPPSIVYNEYLPALQQDPTVLNRMGLKLVQTPRRHACTSRSRRASATRSAASASTSRTSSWSISTTRRTSTCSPMPTRAYSHGCMRVQDPDEVRRGDDAASACPAASYTAEQIKQHVRQLRDRHCASPTPIPVHITYQTAFVDDARQAADPRGHLRPRRPRRWRRCKAKTARSPKSRSRAPSRTTARPSVRLPERRRRRHDSAQRAASRSSTACSVTRYANSRRGVLNRRTAAREPLPPSRAR